MVKKFHFLHLCKENVSFVNFICHYVKSPTSRLIKISKPPPVHSKKISNQKSMNNFKYQLHQNLYKLKTIINQWQKPPCFSSFSSIDSCFVSLVYEKDWKIIGLNTYFIIQLYNFTNFITKVSIL